MLELTNGDILQADAEAIVNAVNCVGVMGRGVALQFRKAYPENYSLYREVCSRNDLAPGKMLTYVRDTPMGSRYIINFPTKVHWKGKSSLDYIDKGLEALVAEVQRLGIQSIALPPLGCGLGGLIWSDVKPRIVQAFAALPDVRVLLYEPAGAPSS
ncbi:MAG: macro domain-containing protein [Armatimonadota bacterium]